MKRAYEKPVLTADSFQLDAAIAASCSSPGKIPIGYADVHCLESNMPDIGLIFNNGCGLDVTVTADAFNYGGDENDMYCYHGPFNPNGLFMRS